MSQRVIEKDTEKRDISMYEPAKLEEDVPFDCSNSTKCVECQSGKIKEEQLKQDSADRELNRVIRATLTSWGFYLIVICFIVIMILYIIDTILVNFKLLNSTLLTPIFELVKSCITILIGYFFALGKYGAKVYIKM